MADLSFLSNASGLYRSTVGGGSKPESYSTTFITPQGNYTFISEDVLNKGLSANGNNYWFPYFQNQENIKTLVDSAQLVDLNDVKASGITSSDTWGKWVSDGLKQSSKGYLVPEGSIPFDSEVKTKPTKEMGNITGLATTKSGELVYRTTGGHGNSYIAPDGVVHDPYVKQGRSTLGKLFGNVGDVFADTFNDALSSVNGLPNWAKAVVSIAYPPAGAVLAAANAGQAAGTGDYEKAAINAGKAALLANAGDGLLGGTPDASAASPGSTDLGGGITINPDGSVSGGTFTGSGDSFLGEAGGFYETTGLESLPPSVNTPEQAFGTGGTEVTADQITNEISSGTAPLSSADKSALYSNAGYGDTMTSAQIDAFDKAVASGMTVSQALDYARAGLFVNAIAGDPLGLSGDTGGAAPASTGFAMVPIPAEWKSPTYAQSSAPIDLSTIFSDQNMLGGTQWQGLPTQQPNVSFNDIFAARQQQTPMGTPVDINQIVSAILGQAATSQKSA